jgi:hypothetical protein
MAYWRSRQDGNGARTHLFHQLPAAARKFVAA